MGARTQALKWVGGKTQLLPQILARLPPSVQAGEPFSYHEPFLGGAAVYRALLWKPGLKMKEARLSDLNIRLVNFYTEVQQRLSRMRERVEADPSRYEDTEFNFYRAREDLNSAPVLEDPTAAALAFLQVNRQGFNGLYRENRQGKCNTPYGHGPKYRKNLRPCFDAFALGDLAIDLHGAVISWTTFGAALQGLSGEDRFVYLDPPFVPAQPQGFTAYTGTGFGAEEQRQLAQACRDMDQRGVRFMASNADTPEIRALYAGFQMDTVMASRRINSRGTGRGKVPELLIYNYRLDREDLEQ